MSSPSNFLLHSFNALTLEEPSDIFSQSLSCVSAPLSAPDIDTQDSAQQFYGRYQKESSAQSLQTTFNASFGLEADYAAVAGDAQVSYTQSEYMTATSVNASYYCVVSCGTTTLKHSDAASIRSLLKPDLLQLLDGIASLADAQAFTESWGTHLITSVKLGGSLSIAIQAATSTVTEQQSVSGLVEADYRSASTSMTATATAAKTVTSSAATASVSQRVMAYGGSAVVAASITCDDPATFDQWAQTCSAGTVQALNTATAFSSLLPPGSVARSQLETYLQLALLAKSLNHPAFLHAIGELKAHEAFSTSVSAGRRGDRILAGGAQLSEDSSSFLMGSYPNLDSNGAIASWIATSHDSGSPASGYLTAYAFAVYDPYGHLTVTVSETRVTSTRNGGDQATATAVGTLVGGGCRSLAEPGSSVKLILGSYPTQASPSSARPDAWTSASYDYINKASNTNLTSYAIGITPPGGLSVVSTIITGPHATSEHGDSQAVCSSSQLVVGGGAQLQYVDNAQNFLQASYPDSLHSWRETNTDANGKKADATHTAYAIVLDAQVVTV